MSNKDIFQGPSNHEENSPSPLELERLSSQFQSMERDLVSIKQQDQYRESSEKRHNEKGTSDTREALPSEFSSPTDKRISQLEYELERWKAEFFHIVNLHNQFIQFQSVISAEMELLKAQVQKTLSLQEEINSLKMKAIEGEKFHQELVILKKKVADSAGAKPQKEQATPIIIQQMHVEKFLVDKYEMTNNLGQLGIKELSGHLNIGATYGAGVPFPAEEKNQGGDSPEENPEKHGQDYSHSEAEENQHPSSQGSNEFFAGNEKSQSSASTFAPEEQEHNTPPETQIEID